MKSMKLTPLGKKICNTMLCILVLAIVGVGAWKLGIIDNIKNSLTKKDTPKTTVQTSTVQTSTTKSTTGSYVPVVGNNEVTVAQSIADFISKSAPDNANKINSDMTNYQKGFSLYKEKKWDEALTYFNEIKAIDPREALATILAENCTVLSSKVPNITLAVAGPMTGDSSQKGINELLGAALAQKQINNSGGISGKKIILQVADDTSNSDQALNVAKQLVDIKSIIGVVGHITSGAVLKSASTYENNKLVAISPSASAPEITNAGNYIFRVCPDNIAQAKFLVDYAIKNNIKKPYIVYNQDDVYSKGFVTTIQNELKANNINLLGNIGFKAQTTNFSSDLNTINKSGADSVFYIGSDVEGTYFVNQLNDENKNIKVYAGDSMYTFDFAQKTKGKSNNVYMASFFHANANQPYELTFVQDFKNEFKGSPNARCALAYDCIMTIKKAIEKSQDSTRDGLYKGLNGLSFDGCTGRITFDKNGDVIDKAMVILQVKNGEFIPIYSR